MRKRGLPAVAVLLLLAGLLGAGTPLLRAAPITPAGAVAPAPPSGSAGQSNGVRRESVPPVQNGPAPLTGPAAPFQPLVVPNFGPNVRANTDTQSPNRAQQEPSIAVNPTNVLDVVAAAKDERAGTNTKQIWIYTSTDGGTTWINQQFPLTPTSPFSSDPVVSFSDTGICYVTALPYGGGGGDGIQVARSLDGGLTFSPGVHLPGSSNNSDKEWTWVDNVPTSPYYHRVYVAWMDFSTGSVIRFNYSTDQGLSWSAMGTVANTANQFPMPVSLPNGNVLVTYDPTGGSVGYRRSTDGGVTFGGLQSISSLTSPPCPPDNSGCGIWRLNAIPSTAVDANNGDLVVTWADGRTSGNARIYYARSTDQGTTWSAAAPLAPPGVTGTYQVEPWVTTDETGEFHAIWYDDRSNPNTSIFDIYYSQSTDDGATWSTAVRISTATTDLRIGIPSSYALAAGDYINVTASHGNVYGVWTDTRSGTGEDIYVVRGIEVQGTPTPTVTGTPPTSTPPPTSTSTVTRTATAPPTATGTPALPTATATPGVPTATGTAPAVASDTPTPAPAASGTPTVAGPPSLTPTPTATGAAPSGTPAAGSPTPVPPATGTPPAATATPGPAAANLVLTSLELVPVGAHRPNLAGQVTINGIVRNAGTAAVPAGSQITIDLFTHLSRCPLPGDPSDISTSLTLAAALGPGQQVTFSTAPFTPTQVGLMSLYGWVNRNRAIAESDYTDNITGPVFACVFPADGQTYSDVPPAAYFYTPVEALSCRGAISGYADGTYRPYNQTTRSQVVKIVTVALAVPSYTPPAGAYTFTDVPPGQPFFPFIETAAHANIVSGYLCGGPGEPCDSQNRQYFRPYANVTRGQLAKIVVAAEGWTLLTPPTGTFADVLPGTAFYPFVETAAAHGLISGYACGGPGEPCDAGNRPYFRQYNDATRGQIAKIVYLGLLSGTGPRCPAPPSQ